MSENKENLSQNELENDVLEAPKKVILKDELNINNNLGSFGETKFGKQEDFIEEQEENNETKLNFKKFENTDKKKDVKINFEKFSKEKVYSDNFYGKFKANLEKKLETRKWLLITWLSYVGITVLFVLIGALLIYFDKHYLTQKNAVNNGNFVPLQNCGKAGYIISFIYACMPVVPFFVLLITWMVGINNVVRSLSFHLFCIYYFLIIFLFCILSVILSSIYIVEFNNYSGILKE